jgi:hypothetical protein
MDTRGLVLKLGVLWRSCRKLDGENSRFIVIALSAENADGVGVPDANV